MEPLKRFTTVYNVGKKNDKGEWFLFLTGFGAVKLDLKTKAKNGVVSDFRIPRRINWLSGW